MSDKMQVRGSGAAVTRLHEYIRRAHEEGLLTTYGIEIQVLFPGTEDHAVAATITLGEETDPSTAFAARFDEKREAMAQARRLALEDAAKVADEFADNTTDSVKWAATRIGKEIRWLLGSSAPQGAPRAEFSPPKGSWHPEGACGGRCARCATHDRKDAEDLVKRYQACAMAI